MTKDGRNWTCGVVCRLTTKLAYAAVRSSCKRIEEIHTSLFRK